MTRPTIHWLALAPPTALALLAAGLVSVLSFDGVGQATISAAPPASAKKTLDPAAWGKDHVGADLPPYTESGECLFCHREQVGGSWQTNKHNRTIREPVAEEPAMIALRADPTTKAFADDVKLILGDTRAQRFLKRSTAYGKADLLSVVASFGRGRRARLESAEKPHWDAETFAAACAGCHATAVNPQTHAFSTVSIDCFSCHGDAPEKHTEDAKEILLAKARKDAPAVVISVCASCHVRFGKSKSSGLPYPNNFVPGDNLFKDFQVDFAKADDEKLNPADRHVMENVRDVVLEGAKA